MRSIHLIVKGQVQGVGFRYMTKERADRLNIKGTVKNLIDGSVEIFAVGRTKDIEHFINIVKQSPSPAGKVTELIQEDILDNQVVYPSFDII
ncbi:acylphosphatase [Atopobacter phocae]|uniref:acylphosphatase n=1 Tax=Atopobacter phocae TaxID=136492 RepID=UPI0004704C72|nr:acylphosphatase [Atopobacter phocae]